MTKHYKQFSLQTVFTLLLLLAVSAMSQAAIRYVKQGGSGNGSSWAAASGDLQAMITASSSGDEVWVAAGTYKPAASPAGCTECTTNRDWAFLLKDGVKVYGGFAATGSPTFAQRNVATNVTILSGDIGTANNASDNTYHVVVSSNDGPTTLIDGFTIRDGNANFVYAFPSPNSYIFYENNYFYRISGGGLYLNMSTTTVSNITFTNNYAEYGGALAVELDNAYNGSVVGKTKAAPAKKDKKAERNALKMEQKQVQQADKTFYSQMREVAKLSKRAGSDAFSMAKPPKQERLNVTKPTQHLSVMAVGATITDCKFLNNSGKYYGGAIEIDESVNTSIKNCYFYQNKVLYEEYYGGAIYEYYSEGTVVDNCTFEENEALDGGEGGAIYVEEDIDIVIKNSTFKKNKVYDSYAGAIYDYYCESIIIDNCKFDGNGEAEEGGSTEGGAIYSYAYDEFTCEVKNSTFENNNAYYGGAIYVSEYSMKISNCVFKKNTAYAGGAVYAYYGGVFDRCTFIENTATGEDSYGGALYFDDEPSSVSNCLFVKNSADYGGGIYLDYYNLSITNSTFVGNIARAGGGGGIYNADSEGLSLTNCILWGNTGTGNADENQILTYDGDYDAITTVKNCDIQDGIPSGSNDDGGNLSVDPLFVNAANGNYRLLACSPLLNVGDNTAEISSLDLDGNNRKFGIIDMGAYEYQGAAVSKTNAYNVTGGGTVCGSNSININLSSSQVGVSYQLKRDNNNVGNPKIGTGSALSFSQNAAGVYTIVATGACGSVSMNGSATIVVYKPNATFTTSSGKYYLCPGSSLTLVAPEQENVAYEWLLNNRALIPAAKNSTLTITQAGPYTLKATGTGACKVSESKQIYINIATPVSYSATNTVTSGKLTLVANPTGLQYNWTGPAAFSSTLRSPVITNPNSSRAGVYTVNMLVPSTGCTGTATTSVKIGNAGRLASGEEAEGMEMEVNAYPNPTSKQLIVEVTLKEPSALKLQLYNATGQTMSNWNLSEETTTHRQEIDMSVYKDGLYLIQAESKNGKQTKRVMKVE